MKELDSVVLAHDLPEYGLKSGDLGTIVLVHEGGAAFEVEFVTLDGETVAVTTLRRDALRATTRHEIAHARAIAD